MSLFVFASGFDFFSRDNKTNQLEVCNLCICFVVLNLSFGNVWMLFSVMAKLWLPLKCRLVFVFLMFLFWSSPFHADKRIKERDKGTLGTHVFIKFARNCLPLLPRPMFWCPRPSDSLSYCLFKGWRPRWCAGRIDNNFARCLPFTCVFSRFGFYLLNLQI